MCVREYKENWEELQKELQENDVLKVSSLLELAKSEEQLKECLECCKQKQVTLQIQNSVLESDVYMGILGLIKKIDEERKKETYEAQMAGIKRALEKKAEGKGGYGRPRVKLPKDFAERVKECIREGRPLDVYWQKTNLKKSTFYKYVAIVKKGMYL